MTAFRQPALRHRRSGDAITVACGELCFVMNQLACRFFRLTTFPSIVPMPMALRAAGDLVRKD